MCGIFGVVNTNPLHTSCDLVKRVCDGLLNLRNRGDESWGLGAEGENNTPNIHWKIGESVTNSLTSQIIKELEKSDSIGSNHNIVFGHVRYATASERTRRNAQPHHFGVGGQRFVLASNGDLPFCSENKLSLEAKGYAFKSNCDADVIVKNLGDLWVENGRDELKAFIALGSELIGAFSLACITPSKKLVLMRDKYGFRPLWYIIDKDNGLIYFCSEDGILKGLVSNTEPIEVQPGEIVIIIPKSDNIQTIRFAEAELKRCLMEAYYFSRPDSSFSQLDPRTFHGIRFQFGLMLGKEWLETGYPKPDMVSCVPFSGSPAAQAFAYKLGVPYIDTIFKDRWAGRVFMVDGESREQLLREKLRAIPDFFLKKLDSDFLPLFMGQSVVVVDDSIVRAHQSRVIIKLLRLAGVKKIGYAVTAPPYKYICRQGINTPDPKLLIAHDRTLDQIQKEIGADYLKYLSLAGTYKVLGPEYENGVCDACFTGNYPFRVPNTCHMAEV